MCPKCFRLSSEQAIACVYCGGPLEPVSEALPAKHSTRQDETPQALERGANETRPPAKRAARELEVPVAEYYAQLRATVPALRPSEFVEKQSENELTISWGMESPLRAIAACSAAVAIVMFGLMLVGGGEALVVPALLVLAAMYWLVAMYANRTVLRLEGSAWVTSRGPLPLPSRDLYYRTETRIDPGQCEAVLAVRDADKEYSWGRTRRLGDILFNLVMACVWMVVWGSRVTYTLYGETRSGRRIELVTGINERQARYLAGKLQGLLDALEQPEEEDGAVSQDAALQSKPDGRILGWLTEPARRYGTCLICGASNPADSAFCGECGAAVAPTEVEGRSNGPN
jgi:hypothetical protein